MPTLDWLNRDAAFEIARKVPYRLLEQVSEHASTTQPSKAPPHRGSGHEKAESRQSLISGLEPTLNKASDDQANASSAAATAFAPTEDNLLIQGDNLEALKSLLPFYRGQVKCIFIDPPYNTKSAFEHYDDNLEHAQWLTMMLPRLQLLRELLSEDGSIWVTIDDNEGHYLKVLMDEVFGRGNFVANVVWQKKYTVSNDAKWLSDNHDHVLAFAKSKEVWRPQHLPRTSEMNDRYRNPDNHPKGVWKATPLYAKRTGSEKEQAFVFQFRNGINWSPPRGSSPRFPLEALRRMDANDEIWFGSDGTSTPSRKTFLADLSADGPPPSTIWFHGEVGHNHEAREEVKEMNASITFATPKPERLLQRIIHIATNPNDLILDSFLGSGTTAAVAQKMGRRWIGIEMGEHAQTHCVPRLQKVLDGEQGGISRAVNWQGGGSFRFMRLGAPIFDDSGAIHPEVKFVTLAAFVWMQETRTPWHKKKGSSPLLGTQDGVAYYLLFNGILGDRRPQGGNVLTSAILAWLKDAHPHPQAGSPRVIYGESVRLGPARLAAENITFKQIPYDVARG